MKQNRQALIFNTTTTGKNPTLADNLLEENGYPNLRKLLEKNNYNVSHLEEDEKNGLTRKNYAKPDIFEEKLENIKDKTNLLLVGISAGGAETIEFLKWAEKTSKQYTKLNKIDILFLSPCFEENNVIEKMKTPYNNSKYLTPLCNYISHLPLVARGLSKLGLFAASPGNTQFKDKKIESDFLYQHTLNQMQTPGNIVKIKLEAIKNGNSEKLEGIDKLGKIHLFIGDKDNLLNYERVIESFNQIFENRPQAKATILKDQEHGKFVEYSNIWIPKIKEEFFDQKPTHSQDT